MWEDLRGSLQPERNFSVCLMQSGTTLHEEITASGPDEFWHHLSLRQTDGGARLEGMILAKDETDAVVVFTGLPTLFRLLKGGPENALSNRVGGLIQPSGWEDATLPQRAETDGPSQKIL